VDNLKGASLVQAPNLPANIKLGCKGIAGSNNLVYHKNSYITDVKSFTTLDSDRFANDEDNPGSSGCLDQRHLVSALSTFYSSSLTKRPVS
jgi:hypothetical protein